MASRIRRVLKIAGWILGVGAVAFLGLVAYGILAPRHWPFESRAQVAQIEAELPEARARWETNGAASYDIDLTHAFVHPACGIMSPITLHVRHGVLLSDTEFDGILGMYCDPSPYLPPRAFQTVAEWLQRSEPLGYYIEVEFDPQYGFIREFHVTGNSSDANVYFTFENYQPLP